MSGNIFRVFGLEPLRGRVFTPDDIEPGRGHVAVVSHELWQTLWGGDPAAVGSTIRVDRETVTILGVMPAGTALPSPEAEIWIPIGPIEDAPNGRFGRWEREFTVIGRLAPGVTPSHAEAEMRSLAAGAAEAFPASNKGWTLVVRKWRDTLVDGARAPLLISFGAVALVLLLACTNIAHLLLVQAAGRSREMALRAALGASRGRLLRQVLTESLILALGGGALGILVAVWLRDLVLALDPGILPRTEAVEIDAAVLLFAFGATLLTGLACGLVPALRSSLTWLHALHGGSFRTVGSRHRNRWRLFLLGGEVALALVLLVGAALLLRALHDMNRVDPGFEPANTYAAHIVLDDAVYTPQEKRRVYFRRLREELARVPGVEAVGLSSAPPVPNMGVTIDLPFGSATGPPLHAANAAEAPHAALRVISPGYLDTVRIPLLRGRDFNDHDDETSPMVVLVNQTLARRLWASEDPVGRRLRILWGTLRDYEVIGVVGDTRFAGLHAPPRPAFFLTHPQMPFLGCGVVARTQLAPAVFEEALRRPMLEIDSVQPYNQVHSLAEELTGSLGTERFFAMIFSIFALLALVLAAAGIYGVFSYWVSQRVNEICVRMALGARADQVLRQVVGQGLAVTAAGIAVGLGGAFLTAWLLGRSFHGIAAIRPGLMMAVALILTIVAFLACLVPARRASRVEPSAALRCE